MGLFDSGLLGGLDTLIRGTNSDKVYGTKPIVPPAPSLQGAQKAALDANAANFGDIAAAATRVNMLNQDQLNALIDKTLGPGVRQSITNNIASQARGEVPQDVQNAIVRFNAARGVGNNAFNGGGFSNNINARDIGMTSLQLTNNALSSAEQWLARAQAPSFNAMGMFGINTEQQYQANTDQFNRDLLASKIAAAPDPSARGQFDSTMALLGMVLSAYGGGPGYKNTYDPNSVFASSGGGGLGAGGQANPMYIPQGYQAPPQGYQSYSPYNQGFDQPSGGGGLGGLAGMLA